MPRRAGSVACAEQSMMNDLDNPVPMICMYSLSDHYTARVVFMYGLLVVSPVFVGAGPIEFSCYSAHCTLI